MKKLLAILFITTACNKPLTKPFIIVGKSKYGHNWAPYSYTFQDVNGREVVFSEETDKYNIGDSIK